jgi:hypothetical protein
VDVDVLLLVVLRLLNLRVQMMTASMGSLVHEHMIPCKH